MSRIHTTQLSVEGMTCDHCVRSVEAALSRVHGVEAVEVSLQEESATVRAPEASSNALLEAVAKAGFRGRILEPDTGSADHRQVDQSSHLIVVGGGSAAFAAAIRASEMGARVTLINEGLPIGGTCVNVGCVPSKTLIRAAEAHYRAAHHNFRGIDSSSSVTDFSSIIAQKRELVEQLRHSKYEKIVAGLPEVQTIRGRARLTSPTSVEVNGERLQGDRILIATGARPAIPSIPGLAGSAYLTNESAYELEDLPDSLIVLGGRYIALETAQMFARLGSKVTILQRSDRILPTETADLTGELTGYLRQEGIEIITGVQLERVSREEKGVVVEARWQGDSHRLNASHLLAATGRRPNTTQMGLEEVGVGVDDHGFISVDETLRSSVETVYAAGDVIGDPMFVYTAAYEGSLAAGNALGSQAQQRDYTALPWVVFTDPQVAGVGLDETQAAEAGLEFDVSTLPLDQIPRSLAARDTRGFIKLIRDRNTDRLLGTRILAPEGGELLMEISLAIKFGITATQLQNSFHPYLTLSEGVKLAAIAFKKDVQQLSCCAV